MKKSMLIILFFAIFSIQKVAATESIQKMATTESVINLTNSVVSGVNLKKTFSFVSQMGQLGLFGVGLAGLAYVGTKFFQLIKLFFGSFKLFLNKLDTLINLVSDLFDTFGVPTKASKPLSFIVLGILIFLIILSAYLYWVSVRKIEKERTDILAKTRGYLEREYEFKVSAEEQKKRAKIIFLSSLGALLVILLLAFIFRKTDDNFEQRLGNIIEFLDEMDTPKNDISNAKNQFQKSPLIGSQKFLDELNNSLSPKGSIATKGDEVIWESQKFKMEQGSHDEGSIVEDLLDKYPQISSQNVLDNNSLSPKSPKNDISNAPIPTIWGSIGSALVYVFLEKVEYKK